MMLLSALIELKSMQPGSKHMFDQKPYSRLDRLDLDIDSTNLKILQQSLDTNRRYTKADVV